MTCGGVSRDECFESIGNELRDGNIIDAGDRIARTNLSSRGGGTRLDRDDDRHALDLANRQTNGDIAWVPPVKLFIRRIDARVRVFERRDHLAHHFVELEGAVCFRGGGTKSIALCLPVDTVVSGVVVARLDRFPNVVEDSESTFNGCGRDYRWIIVVEARLPTVRT